MTSLLDRSATPLPGEPAHRSRHRRRRWPWVAALLCVAIAVTAFSALVLERVRASDLHRDYLAADAWPTDGQAAYRYGGVDRSSPGQTPAPIASLAKVMTAYLVLHSLPLGVDAPGPVLTVSSADVRDYEARRDDDQSVVAVRRGERLTERQALTALLLPSANNIAVLLARRVAGTVPEFVDRMNAVAAGLGMTRTRYTDPSGYDRGTVSTARDQVVLATAMAGNAAFGDLVARTQARLPVVGTVRNTNSLLGHDGFVGTKTGSDDAAGGCFMFRTWRVVHEHVTDVIGVVLGQRGRHAVTAGLTAARQLADRIGPAAGA
jgi:D-alanyl-D-alanine carboxypeptidase (penicillin-binding protein 5/6)